MLATHKVIRRSHKHRKEARAASADVTAPFDALRMIEVSRKHAEKGDELEIVDAVAWDAFELQLTLMIMDWLSTRQDFAVEASKTAYLLLLGKDYEPRLARQMMVGASALAMECMVDRIAHAAHEVIRQLLRVPHEDFPGLVDETSFEDAAAMVARFEEERASGERWADPRPSLFGKGAGIPPKERKRMAAESASAEAAGLLPS